MSITINNRVSSSYKISMFYLILLFIVAGSGWFATRYMGDKARQEILQFNEITILTHSSHFTGEFGYIERGVRVLSGSPLIAPALISRKDVDMANANSTLDRHNSDLGSSVSYLLDSNGVTIASSNRNDPDSFVGKSYQFRPYFIQAMQDTPGRYFALGATSLKRGFYASYPVKDSNGHIIGVVVIKEDIEEKEADISRYPYFFLVDPNGIIFLSSRKEMTFKSLWPVSQETRQALLESGQFGKREFDAVLPREIVDGMEIKFDGRNYLASRKVINPEGWSTVIMTSTEKVLQYQLVGVIITMWICTLIVIPMIISHRTSRFAEMVRASETRYRELFDNTSSGVAIFEVKDGGKDFILKNFNKAAERIEGVRKEDIIGKSIHEVRPGIKEFGLLDVFERVWRTGIPEHHPASFYHDQELAVWFENFVYKLPTGEMVAVYDDITERMRAEEALRESEQKYRRIVETANEGICMTDVDNLVTYVNQRMADMLGYLPEEIIGKPLVHFLFPEDLADHREKWSHRLQGLSETYERRFRRSDGGECWTIVSVTVIRNEDGRFMGGFGMLTDITERKRAEEEIRQTNAYLENIFENSPDVITIVDTHGRFIKWNKMAAELYGYTFEEMKGKSAFDLYADKDELEKMLMGLRREGSVKKCEIRMRRKDGKIIPSEVSIGLLHDIENRTLGSVGVARDLSGIKETLAALRASNDQLNQEIIERKRADETLKKTEAEYRAIFENTGMATIILEEDTTISLANAEFEKLTGYTRDEVENKKCWTEFVVKEDRERMLDQHRLRRADEKAALKQYEFRLIDRNDETRYCLLTVDMIADTKRSIASFFDITERRQAEETLKRLKRHNELILNSAGEGILGFGPEGRHTFVNPAAARMLGYMADELIGRKGHDLYHHTREDGRPYPEEDCPIFQAFRNGKFCKVTEEVFWRKDGTSFPVRCSSAPIIEDGEVVGAVVTFRDITEYKRGEKERKKLEEQLFQAQKMESVGRLAGGVAHDFNNMLGVIIGRAELALNTDVSTDKLQYHLEEILDAGLRSADLTRQLLAFARKQTAIPRILDLNLTISGMLSMLRRLIGEDIDLLWAPELDLWKVKIDPSQVDQVLANLVVNARDAISGVGAVTMRTENVVIDDSKSAEAPELIAGEYVLLIVSDTGTGMSKEVRENIFEPFFTTKELGKGTGLGLSTVYGIVKQNDGFIYVASEPEKGTTFKIYLPRFERETAQVASEEINVKRPTGTETILLVEDDEAILNLSKIILENLGYKVLAAQTPGQAIRLVEEHPGDIHLLITDVVMPEMNGRELAELLSAIRPNLRRIYISGYTADVIAHHGILDEGLNFIQKPFGSDVLAARVRHVLDHLEDG
ncbi:MAG: PAS domain S-box protein [Syntrophobacteraceae bacterium]